MSIRDYQLYIDGQFTGGVSGQRFVSCSRSDGTEVASFAGASEGDAEAAVRAARRAFDDGPWPAMTVTERARRLGRVLELLGARAPELTVMEYQDNGATVRQASAFMVPAALGFATGMTDIALRFPLADGAPVSTGVVPGGPFGTPTVTYEPIGVVGAITPWNGPLILAMWKAWPALLAGNTVVLKPSELAPSTAMELARAFAEADIPAGVFNVVTGGGGGCGRVVKRAGKRQRHFPGGTGTGQRDPPRATGKLSP